VPRGATTPDGALSDVPAMEHVDAGGLRIAFRRGGDGPCLLLLHGAVSDGRVWRVELDSLSDEFTVVAWDAPGCGGSSDPPEHYRLPEFAACLGLLIDALGLERPHVLGHSWGSALALELYRQRPSDVRSLVLVGAYAGWAGSLAPAQVAHRLQFALQVADLPAGTFEPTSMPGLFSDVMPDDRRSELATIMSEIRPAATRTMARALAEADLRGLLPLVDVPTLLVYGDADERSPLEVAHALHAAMPRSTLTVMPGLGHECHLESPKAFETAVRSFLLGLEDLH
jgi:pimeloyl-ACP methyl ester carboxylesterase